MTATHPCSDAASRVGSASAKPSLVVIGSGIAGLSAAWLLKQKYDVTLIESHDKVGMGVFSVDYQSAGVDNRIDIPLRVFCDGYYPNLLALYRHIGVEIEAGDHAGVFFDHRGKEVLHYGNVALGRYRFSLPKLKSLFSWRAWRLMLAFRRFNRLAQQALLTDEQLRQKTLQQFLQQQQIDGEFTEQLLLPVLAVTCTCDYHSILNYPADVILAYLTCGVWQFGIIHARNGVDDIVPRLTQGIQVQTGQAVQRVRSCGEQLQLTLADGQQQRFDQVVIACQAQQAAAMLDGFDQQQAWLRQVPFETSTMMVHTDSGFLPQQGKGCSAVSYCLPPQGEQRPQVSVDLTKAIPRYRQQGTVFQTWHPTFEPGAGQLLAKVAFTRPLVTLESRAAMQQLRQQQQQQCDNRLWFCGSYLADKVPLLDAAVDSSVAVAEALGVEIPWQAAGH